MFRNLFIPKQSRYLDWLVGLGLTLVILVLYSATLAPTVLEADSGEFQFVPWLPGITHPTGYPLYTLLGWLWTHLFHVGEVAWRMNLLSALFGAATIGFTYAIIRQLLDKTLPDTPLVARIVASVTAAAALAVTHTFWGQAIIAEVYTLHTLFIATMLWLALKLQITGRDFNTWPAKLLTFTFGLSLTHHSTTVLLLPALILFLLLPTAKQSDAPKRSTNKIILLLTHVALFIVPILLYLYLPLIAPITPYATLTLSDRQILTLYDNTLSGFLNHILARVFIGELQPAAVGLERFNLTWQLLYQQVGWIGLILAIAGLVTLWRQRQFDLLVLTGVSSVTFTLFNLIYFIGDVFVLFIPVWWFVCLWIGIGVLGLAHWLARSFVQQKTGPKETRPVFYRMEQHLAIKAYNLLIVVLVGGGFLVCVLPLVILNFGVSQKNNITARERWLQILAEPIPENAVLVSNNRNEIMPMWYFQYVEGRRPDLLGLFPLIVTDPAYANVGRVLEQALASGRPVYLIKAMDGLEIKAHITPVGTLYQATANNTPPMHLHEVIFASSDMSESIRLLGYDMSPATVSPGNEIILTLHWQVVTKLSQNYTSYVHLIDSNDQGITQSDHRPGGDFYPSSYWEPGEVLHDSHILTLPPNAPGGQYRLQVGMYYQPEPGQLISLNNSQEIGSVTVSSE